MIDFDTICAMALKLEGVEEQIKWDDLVMARNGRFMFRPMKPGEKRLEGYEPREGSTVVVFRTSWERHDELLDMPESKFFKKPHYEGWPGILVETADLDEALAQELIQHAWEVAPSPASKRPKLK